MIDWNKSAELNGCSIDELKAYFNKFPNSHKDIVAICDGCNISRVVTYQAYCGLCIKCGHNTNEFKQKISSVHKGKHAPNILIFHANTQKEICNKYIKGCSVVRLGIEYRCHTRIITRCLVDNGISIRSYTEACKYRPPATKESKERMSAGHQGLTYEDWDGYTDPRRTYLKPYSECWFLNPEIEGCERHHIMTGVVINIPNHIHKSVYHRMNRSDREGNNMDIINQLAIDYLVGDIQ